ncbi:MAG TPA: hypothetical protein VFN57_18540, partial [Thermomicrobiaceae bacterium]|nr:hypothetical protein [Thermomicrobiaceae bacterium]
MAQAPATFPLRFAEGDVRRLCGPGTFQRADRLERAGHVLGASTDGSALGGRVRGTWRRVDQVAIGTRGGQLVPACGCGLPGFCQHAGALALHWLRAAADFRPAPAGAPPLLLGGGRPGTSTAPAPAAVERGFERDLDVDDVDEAADELVARTPEEELRLALEQDRANHLRRVARERGVRLSGNAKADMVQQLVPVLLDPA